MHRLLCGVALTLLVLGCGRSQLELPDDDAAVDAPVADTPVVDGADIPDVPIVDAPRDDGPPIDNPNGCNGGPACGVGAVCCADGCANLTADPLNCGGCGVRCAADEACRVGRCVRVAGCAMGCPMGALCCTDACVDVLNDPNNCGGCSQRCPAGSDCVAGACVDIPGCGGGPPCGVGTTCCGVRCVDTRADATNCGACGRTCTAGQFCADGMCRTSATCAEGSPCDGGFCCNDRCVDTLSDRGNCGGCGVVCPATAVCAMGTCVSEPPVCPSPLTLCGDRCVDTQSDDANCGACGRVCADSVCVGGACMPTTGCGFGPPCAAGQQCCGTVCVDTQNDRSNCGACGRACPAGTACFAGACTPEFMCNGGLPCPPGATCCTNRCVGLQSDASNCGACGRVCPAGAVCTDGLCRRPTPGCGDGPACAAGEACCDAACVDVSGDARNCGACGRVCPAPANTRVSCRASACVNDGCAMGFADCNGVAMDGCEVNTQTDTANCGACGNACPAGRACRAGACDRPSSGSEGAFNPVVNPTFLSPGVHEFTTINVPAGVVVYVAGGGADSGVLDLRATGAVTINGTIDVSGGPGAQSVITSSSTRTGRPGAGGFTGDPRTATPGPACEWTAGVPGGNGRGFVGSTGTCRVGSNTACITDNTTQLIFASPAAVYGGGGGVFTGYRAYGGGGGGFAGGGPGALGAAYPGQSDCAGATGGGGAATGQGGRAGAGLAVYNGGDGALGQTQCPGVRPGIPASWVGGGGGGSIGAAAASDLAVSTTFYPGSGGGGGSADYLNRPAFGGTSGGGGGGGALRVWSETIITINGSVLANGGDGGDAYIGTSGMAGCDPQPGAAGGGGSGGVIFLRAPRLVVSSRARVSAAGGRGGAASLYATGGRGGAGGVGRIRVSATPSSCSLLGSFNPPLVSGCTPTASPTAGRAYVAAFPQ
ncbi:MAG: hypothetical protein R3A52_25625 [Polyangiales bacterium]